MKLGARLIGLALGWAVLFLAIGVGGPALGSAKEDKAELIDELVKVSNEYQQVIEDYKREIDNSIQLKYEEKKQSIKEKYSSKLSKLRREERIAVQEAINSLEAFIGKYPNHPVYTPEALFRLADLYFVEALTLNGEAVQYEMKSYSAKSQREKQQLMSAAQEMYNRADRYYRRSRRLAERIISDFPKYKKRDLAYLEIARVCGNTQDYYCMQDALENLVNQYPNSSKAPIALFRLGLLYYDQYRSLKLPPPEERLPIIKKILAEDAKIWAEAEGKTEEEKARIYQQEMQRVNKEIADLEGRRIDKRRFGTIMARHYFLRAYSLPPDVWGSPANYAGKVLYLLAITEFVMYGHEWRAADCLEKFLEYYEKHADNSPEWRGIKDRVLQAKEIYAYLFTTVYNMAMGSDLPDGTAARMMRERFEKIGKRKWQRDVYFKFINFSILGRYYHDAIEAYRAILALDPLNPDNPEIHYKMMLVYNDYLCKEDEEACKRFMDKEREAMAVNYGEGSAWYEANRDNPTALAKAYSRLKSVISAYGNDHFARGDQLAEEGRKEEARKEYLKAASVFRSFLKQFPNDPDAYDIRMQLADALYSAEDYQNALVEYEKVRDSRLATYFKGQAALYAYLCYDKLIEKAGLLQKEQANLNLTPEEMAAREKISDEPGAGYRVKPREMPEIRKRYIEAAEKFLEWYDSGYEQSLKEARIRLAEAKDKDAKEMWRQVIKNMTDELHSKENKRSILYNIGFFYFAYHDFDKARGIFDRIIKEFPGSREALLAYRYKLFMYTAEERLADILSWCDKTVAYIHKYQGKYPKEEAEILQEVGDVKARASFDLAMAYKRTGNYEKAAKQFEEFAEKYADNKNAPIALYNAAAMYLKAKLFASASKLYKKFVDRYPNHPDTPGIRLNLAITAYYGFELKEAEEQFTKLYTQGKNVPRYYRCMALYFRSQLFEYDHRYSRAARGFENYSKTCRNISDAEVPKAFRKELPPFRAPEVLYHAFEVYKKADDLKGMERTLAAFEKNYSRDKEFSFFLIQGYYYLSEKYDKMGKRNKRDDYYDKIIRYFKSRPEFKDIQANPNAALAHKFAAKAEFIKLEPRFRKFSRMELSCSGADKATIKKRLKKKITKELRKQLKRANKKEKARIYAQLKAAIDAEVCVESQKRMTEFATNLVKDYSTVSSTYIAPYAVVAKYRIGRIFELMGDRLKAVAESDLPKHLQSYIDSLNEQISDLENVMNEFDMLMMENPDPNFQAQMQEKMDKITKVVELISKQIEDAETGFREPRQQDAVKFYTKAAEVYQQCFKLLGIFGTDPEMVVWRERIREALARPSVRRYLTGDFRLLRRDIRPVKYDLLDVIPMQLDSAGISMKQEVKEQQEQPLQQDSGAQQQPNNDETQNQQGSDQQAGQQNQQDVTPQGEDTAQPAEQNTNETAPADTNSNTGEGAGQQNQQQDGGAQGDGAPAGDAQ